MMLTLLPIACAMKLNTKWYISRGIYSDTKWLTWTLEGEDLCGTSPLGHIFQGCYAVIFFHLCKILWLSEHTSLHQRSHLSLFAIPTCLAFITVGLPLCCKLQVIDFPHLIHHCKFHIAVILCLYTSNVFQVRQRCQNLRLQVSGILTHIDMMHLSTANLRVLLSNFECCTSVISSGCTLCDNVNRLFFEFHTQSTKNDHPCLICQCNTERELHKASPPPLLSWHLHRGIWTCKRWNLKPCQKRSAADQIIWSRFEFDHAHGFRRGSSRERT